MHTLAARIAFWAAAIFACGLMLVVFVSVTEMADTCLEKRREVLAGRATSLLLCLFVCLLVIVGIAVWQPGAQ